MAGSSGVAAHLIVGAREEPFLDALLRSLHGAVDAVIVNDNSPGASPHADAFARSAFAGDGTLVIDRSPWVDFAHARNRCLAVHRERNAGGWAAFVDADEVHGERFAHLAAHAHAIPPNVDAVDAYTWHFFQSFDWYHSIERRMTLFRCLPDVAWTGRVHEQLAGLGGKRVVVPYVYAHYGNVLPARRQAEKGRQYSALGAPGLIASEAQLATIDAATFYPPEMWASPLRFTGTHPPAAAATIADLRARYAAEFAQTERLIRAHQPPRRRIENVMLKLNYEQRWRLRALDPLAQRLVS
jgi:hypothetical protein